MIISLTDKVLDRIGTLPFGYRVVFIIVIQLGLAVASYLSSFVMRLDPVILDLNFDLLPTGVIVKTLPLLVFARIASMLLFQAYRGVWRYFSVTDLFEIIKTTTAGSFAFALLLIFVFDLQGFPRSVIALDWAGNIVLLSGVRMLVRAVREGIQQPQRRSIAQKRILIVGAGDAGAALCAEALTSAQVGYTPVAFVDDHSNRVGTSILGVPVAGQINDIPSVVRRHRIDLAVIADNSTTPAQMRHFMDLCRKADVDFKVLPSTADLLDGKVSLTRIRELDIEDLLGRPPATLDRDLIHDFIKHKRILVTGAAGSVGSELVRQLASLDPASFLLIDHAENPLYLLEMELQTSFPHLSATFRVDDVTDDAAMNMLMVEHQPQLVFHAAAHKHVPLMERTPALAVRNNVGGTYCVALAAQNAGVETFVLVSTDKAAGPSSVMGATKRLSELLVQRMNNNGSTTFVSVRFGNVIGSSGSVVPIFKQQIASGGPVTVTHPRVTRYFMSVSEAAGLIMQAAAFGRPGDIFVLDMGEPLSILRLAETLIDLSGLEPGEEIPIVFTGLRPGEKMSEVLHTDRQELQKTRYEKLLLLKEDEQNTLALEEVERLLRDSPASPADQVIAQLKRLVPEYRPFQSTDHVPA